MCSVSPGSLNNIRNKEREKGGRRERDRVRQRNRGREKPAHDLWKLRRPLVCHLQARVLGKLVGCNIVKDRRKEISAPTQISNRQTGKTGKSLPPVPLVLFKLQRTGWCLLGTGQYTLLSLPSPPNLTEKLLTDKPRNISYGHCVADQTDTSI